MSSTLLNYKFPFYLDNNSLGQAFYLYEVVTPGLTEDNTPLTSFKKIAEKTRSGDLSYDKEAGKFNDLDILNHLAKKSKWNSESYFNKEILNRERDYRKKNVTLYDMGPGEFPAFELSNLFTKAAVISLRDNLRWQFYRFQQGKLVDVLLTPTVFGVFEIKGDSQELWLEFKNSYSTNDPAMIRPLGMKSRSFEGTKFKGFSDLNRALRAREWKAFDEI